MLAQVRAARWVRNRCHPYVHFGIRTPTQTLPRALSISAQTRSLNLGTVDEQIAQILIDKFQPGAIQVINQSRMHSKGDETHYKVIMAGSEQLNSINRRVKQHQTVMKELKDTMANTTLHSVSLQILADESEIKPEHRISPGCANHKNRS